MNQHLFLLGKASDLCFAELETVFSYQNKNISRLSDNLAITDDQIDPRNLVDILGGTVKIAKILSVNPVDQLDVIISDLKDESQRPNFSLYGFDKSLSFHVKNQLKDLGLSSRFVNLSDIYKSAISLQKNYHEYWLLNIENQTYIAKLVAYQNITDWNKRDYDRPKVDPKSGMLPPKIARILVNLSTSPFDSTTIYDPFCGSGTILSEALMLGHNVIGSDFSQKAIDDSKENLNWLKTNYSISGASKLFNQDATHVKNEELGSKINAIVFEPYMGPPSIKPEKIKNIAKGLEKLYIGALKNLSHVLPKGKKLVCILPKFSTQKIVKTTDSLIDRCENFGYTRQAGPLIYSRPNSIVVRQIYILVKN